MNDQLIEETKDIVRNFTFYDIYIYIYVYSRGKKKLFRSSVGRRYITRYIRSVVKHQGNWFSQRYNLELAGNKRCCVSASRQLVSYNVTRFILHIYSLGRLTFDSVLREWVRIQDKKKFFSTFNTIYIN